MCVVYLEPSSYPGTHPGTHPRTQTMNFSEPSGKRGHRSEPSGKRGHMASPRECKQTRKNDGVQKTQTLPMVRCGPRAPEVTNLNAVASNLLRTRFNLRVNLCQIQLSL